MTDLYANCAAALRAMLPRLSEPDQQVVATAALALDLAGMQAKALESNFALPEGRATTLEEWLSSHQVSIPAATP